ncbi:hypothetical protein L1987_21630 [Smallanthus sonchifolius]|uniref:Uncharacterized protein n=1 Tax=Smallanthus sonchifolius TaxID=185202 RepID=A0ACB9IED0_9ASTR|nr:hypothetical protein L1987_21630 [Smallanthus sonchifolius]
MLAISTNGARKVANISATWFRQMIVETNLDAFDFRLPYNELLNCHSIVRSFIRHGSCTEIVKMHDHLLNYVISFVGYMVALRFGILDAIDEMCAEMGRRIPEHNARILLITWTTKLSLRVLKTEVRGDRNKVLVRPIGLHPAYKLLVYKKMNPFSPNRSTTRLDMFMAFHLQIPSPDDEIGLPITYCLHNSVIAVNGYRSAMAYESDHYRNLKNVAIPKLAKPLISTPTVTPYVHTTQKMEVKSKAANPFDHFASCTEVFSTPKTHLPVVDKHAIITEPINPKSVFLLSEKLEVTSDYDKEPADHAPNKGPRYDDDGIDPNEDEYMFVRRVLNGTSGGDKSIQQETDFHESSSYSYIIGTSKTLTTMAALQILLVPCGCKILMDTK